MKVQLQAMDEGSGKPPDEQMTDVSFAPETQVWDKSCDSQCGKSDSLMMEVDAQSGERINPDEPHIVS